MQNNKADRHKKSPDPEQASDKSAKKRLKKTLSKPEAKEQLSISSEPVSQDTQSKKSDVEIHKVKEKTAQSSKPKNSPKAETEDSGIEPQTNSSPSKIIKSPSKAKAKILDLIMIFIGFLLIIVAAMNLFKTNPLDALKERRVTPVVDQEGFAPIFIPKEAAREQFTAEVSASPSIPERIVIEKIDLDAPVKIAQSINVTIDDQEVTQYLVPEEFAVGWHEGSASLGLTGNTVISGHHNAFGEVFKDLVDLETGDKITLLSGRDKFVYTIANKMILSEKNEPLEVRIENGRWILSSDDERLTLVTCWPERSNTHRLILVAVPDPESSQKISVEATPTPNKIWIQTTPPLDDISDSLTPKIDSGEQLFEVLNTGRFTVNIRDIPDMMGEIVGKLTSGADALGLGRTSQGDWIFIKFNDISGWVSAELVEVRVPNELLPTMVPTRSSP